jgi:FAD/FMN-containing dehydrogenase
LKAVVDPVTSIHPVRPVHSAYLEDAGGYTGYADELYVPANEEELSEILRAATRDRIPVTVSGAGTGLAGGRVPHGGWAVSLEKFSGIAIDKSTAVAGAGVLLRDLQQATARHGMFYPPDPTEMGASIGGTIATNASGSRSFRCGDTRRNVTGLRVMTMDGTARTFSRGDAIDFAVPDIQKPRTTKHSTGFPLHPGMDWVDLFIGSEGTLGIVTQASLRLLPNPEEILAGVCFFGSDADALAAVEAWRTVPRLRMIEYFDAGSLRLVGSKYDVPGGAAAALLIEHEIRDAGEVDAWEDRLLRSRAMTEQSWFASSDVDRERFRRFRHSVPEAVNDTVRRRGLMKLGSDCAVPFEANREMMAYYRAVLDTEFPDAYVIFGHIGDAHVHVNILPRNAEEFERGKLLMIEFARKAVSLGGTVSAEHGLGKRKAHLLALQYSAEQIAPMMAVKRRLDPHWLLGQGTLFPVQSDTHPNPV